MSVLVIEASGSDRADPYMDAAVDLLLRQGDEVRVLEHPGRKGDADRFKERGAYVARGQAIDADLIDRAAQNARTVVVMDLDGRAGPELLEAVFEGARFASVERIVLCGGKRTEVTVRALDDSRLQYVALWAGGRRLLRGTPVDPGALAQAVDAADDLAGEPRLELELTDPDAWAELRLAPPPRP